MKRKVLEKAYALGLRKKGQSYNEILKRVPASKSTLSRWLRGAELSGAEQEQVRAHTGGNRAAGKGKAAATIRANRDAREADLRTSMEQVYAASKGEPLFQTGLALYWASGSKTGTAFQITSQDPDLLRLMLEWVQRYLKVPREHVQVRLYIAKDAPEERCREAWAGALSVSPQAFRKSVRTKGKKAAADPAYRGSARIEITKDMPVRKIKVLNGLFLDEYKKHSTV